MTAIAKVVQAALGPVEVAELGEGPTVILLHGSMGGWQQSELFARTFGDTGYRYLLVSRPGYMRTPLSSGESSAAQADLYAALLDALGIETAAIIGISAGSPSAIDFAIRHPDCNWGLVLISACASKTATPKPPAVFKIMAQFMRLSWLRNWTRARWEKSLDKPAAMFISDPETRARTIADPEVGPLFAQFMTGTFDEMHLRMRGTDNDIKIMTTTNHALEELGVETLVMHGTKDNFLSYDEHAKAFEARIPKVELISVDGGEHAIMFTDRERVREAVSTYLLRHAPKVAATVGAAGGSQKASDDA